MAAVLLSCIFSFKSLVLTSLFNTRFGGYLISVKQLNSGSLLTVRVGCLSFVANETSH